MRKETRTEEKVVATSYTVFIADDGTEFDGFDAEKRCKSYEKDKQIEYLAGIISEFEIKEYGGFLPFPIYDEWRDCDCRWYNIKNEEEFKLIEDYYYMSENYEVFSEPKSYPAVLCVVEYDGYVDGYYLDEIIKGIKNFLGTFNMIVDIKEGE